MRVLLNCRRGERMKGTDTAKNRSSRMGSVVATFGCVKTLFRWLDHWERGATRGLQICNSAGLKVEAGIRTRSRPIAWVLPPLSVEPALSPVPTNWQVSPRSRLVVPINYGIWNRASLSLLLTGPSWPETPLNGSHSMRSVWCTTCFVVPKRT
jgi:hypothetical protein